MLRFAWLYLLAELRRLRKVGYSRAAPGRKGRRLKLEHVEDFAHILYLLTLHCCFVHFFSRQQLIIGCEGQSSTQKSWYDRDQACIITTCDSNRTCTTLPRLSNCCSSSSLVPTEAQPSAIHAHLSLPSAPTSSHSTLHKHPLQSCKQPDHNPYLLLTVLVLSPSTRPRPVRHHQAGTATPLKLKHHHRPFQTVRFG